MATATAKKKKMLTPIFRVSFPSVFNTAQPMKNADGTVQAGKPKYEVTMIFEPGKFTPDEKQKWLTMRDAADTLAVEKFKRKTKDFPANFRNPFRKGEEKEHLSGYGPGTIFVKASSHMKPGIVAGDKVTPILDDEGFYPGCYARASVTVYSFDNRSKGIAFGLHNLMFVKDGERFDSRTDASEDFGEAPLGDVDELGGDDDDDMLS